MHALAGLGQWLQPICAQRLAGTPHLVKSSSEMLRRCSSIVFPGSVMALKLDIDSYFLTGTTEFHQRCISSHFPAELQEHVKEAVSVLLDNQFVVHPSLPSVQQVILGAGMGLNFAGERSDLSFLTVAEQTLADDTGFKPLLYCRFKDDIDAIFDDCKSRVGHWLSIFRQRAAPYKVNLEELSSDSVPFLDIGMRLVPYQHGTRIKVEPYQKPTSGKIPLQSDSCHEPTVHLSWPRMELSRLRNLCDDSRMYAEVERRFVGKFKTNGEPNNLIEYFCTPNFTRRARKETNALWCVIRYHPLLHRPIVKLFKNVVGRFEAQLANIFAGRFPDIRISSKSHGLPLIQILRKISSQKTG